MSDFISFDEMSTVTNKHFADGAFATRYTTGQADFQHFRTQYLSLSVCEYISS
jgi:hypothetical protein